MLTVGNTHGLSAVYHTLNFYLITYRNALLDNTLNVQRRKTTKSIKNTTFPTQRVGQDLFVDIYTKILSTIRHGPSDTFAHALTLNDSLHLQCASILGRWWIRECVFKVPSECGNREVHTTLDYGWMACMGSHKNEVCYTPKWAKPFSTTTVGPLVRVLG